MNLKDAIKFSEANLRQVTEGRVLVGEEQLKLLVEAARTQVSPPQYIPVWEVRCVEFTYPPVPGTCIGYIPHIAVRLMETEANQLAVQWRARANRDCVEIRQTQHLVSE